MAHTITITTTRTTIPDGVAMLAAIRSATGDPTAVLLSRDGVTAEGKKSTDWTPAQIASAQTIFDTVAPLTPQTIAQREIDNWPITLRALVLTLIDELNILRQHPAIGLQPRTPQQAITAIRNKAGTLS
jgi:hypothetical protein